VLGVAICPLIAKTLNGLSGKAVAIAELIPMMERELVPATVGGGAVNKAGPTSIAAYP